MSAIEPCRSAARGGHVERCQDCGHSRIAYNSCRNRHCPKCQGAAARDWLAAREADLLPVGSFHLVFTLPAEISGIAYQNKAVVYDLLFRAAAETRLTIAADPRPLGARIGFTAVLHTWGSAMTHHPHLHIIVPGGGILLGGTHWVSCRSGFLLPVRVLSRLFRRLFLAGLADAQAAGRLAFFGELGGLHSRSAFAPHLAPLRRKNWFVYARPPFAGPEAVLAYLARYTHRVAIANSRLLALDARGVTFRYKDYRRDGQARYRTMTLAPDEFIRRSCSTPCPRGPPHPPLRAARQRRLQGQHRARPGIDRYTDAVDRDAGRARRGAQCRHWSGASPAMPLLRRPHDHRRDPPAQRRTPRPTTVRCHGRDRNVMTTFTASLQHPPPEQAVPAPHHCCSRHCKGRCNGTSCCPITSPSTAAAANSR
jgi:hypothetical protein